MKLKKLADDDTTLSTLLDTISEGIDSQGLDFLGSHPAGNLAAFRPFELAAALNRLRTLQVRQKP